MAYVGKSENMRPDDRWGSPRLRAIMEQTVNEPWLREPLLGLLYRVEQLEAKLGMLEKKNLALLKQLNERRDSEEGHHESS